MYNFSVSRESDQETGECSRFSNRIRIQTDFKFCSMNTRPCKIKHCPSCTYCNRAATQEGPVGARLNHFWEVWAGLGAGPKVIQMLKDGYNLPFQTRPNLTRSPTIVSCYIHPHRNLYLLEALHQLTNKNTVGLVQNQTSLGVYNRLFSVPKPNNNWRPVLDLSFLNHFLKAEKFKIETPETIWTSLQTGEWAASVDFKDACFHIPIYSQENT